MAPDGIEHEQPQRDLPQKPNGSIDGDTPIADDDADDSSRVEPFPSLPLDTGTDRAPLFPDDDDADASRTASPGGASDSGVSEQVTSPSISSPPYWTYGQTHQLPSPRTRQQQYAQQHGQGGHGHGRTVSSVSVESVLPPGAITLQDNESDEGPDGRNVYGRDRNKACWARSVEVTDYVMVNGSTTNIGAFVVWHIKVETLNGSRINIRKRYSEFEDLRKKLVQTFPNFEAAVPVLPPKSVLQKFKESFLAKRRVGLQYFLNCILLNPEFSGSPVLKEFLFS